MEPITLILLAVSLAMDAFAVAVSGGTVIRQGILRHALIIGAFFGFFQGMMPVLGWLAGVTLADIIAGYGSSIAFLLLALVGGKMIYEAIRESDEKEEPELAALSLGALLLLSVATSIDALAVGVTFAVLGTPILIPVLVIALVTAGIAALGVVIGSTFGHIFERKIEIAGGVILIGIGLRILIEGLS